jgi:hypothetical protein
MIDGPIAGSAENGIWIWGFWTLRRLLADGWDSLRIVLMPRGDLDLGIFLNQFCSFFRSVRSNFACVYILCLIMVMVLCFLISTDLDIQVY